MPVLWCNGEWISTENLRISPTDRGILVGLSLFETILGVDGSPKFLDRHLERLANACSRLGWQPPTGITEAILRDLLGRNELTTGHVRIRLTLTGGSGAISDLTRGEDAASWISAAPAGDFPETTTAGISTWKRNEFSPLAGLKCGSYAENILAYEDARKSGFEQPIFLNTSGHLCEAATSNVFLVRNGRLLTPPLDSGCLPGITRTVVMDLARQNGVSCEEIRLEKGDIENADEIFLTSSIRGPVPVSRLDQRPFSGTPVGSAIQRWWKDAICAS